MVGEPAEDKDLSLKAGPSMDEAGDPHPILRPGQVVGVEQAEHQRHRAPDQQRPRVTPAPEGGQQTVLLRLAEAAIVWDAEKTVQREMRQRRRRSLHVAVE